jgi:hypothetical protein
VPARPKHSILRSYINWRSFVVAALLKQPKQQHGKNQNKNTGLFINCMDFVVVLFCMLGSWVPVILQGLNVQIIFMDVQWTKEHQNKTSLLLSYSIFSHPKQTFLSFNFCILIFKLYLFRIILKVCKQSIQTITIARFPLRGTNSWILRK